jgi:hypothetical protein
MNWGAPPRSVNSMVPTASRRSTWRSLRPLPSTLWILPSGRSMTSVHRRETISEHEQCEVWNALHVEPEEQPDYEGSSVRSISCVVDVSINAVGWWMPGTSAPRP